MKQISVRMFGLLVLLIMGTVAAQSMYPEKPVRIVVGFTPGSQADIVARLVGQKFAEVWGKAVVVDNAGGAAGNIGSDRVAKAAPDGYTLGVLSQGQLVVNPSLYKLPFDPMKDFAPVSQLILSPNVLVLNNAVPAKNVKELVALAKAEPGGLTFASSGSGSSLHMAAELFKSMAGIDIRHIAYRGVPETFPDLISGRVTMMFSTISPIVSLVREGKLRALAVTSARRSPTFPELPTIDEAGIRGFEATLWYGLTAPARTPATIISRLHTDTVKALAQTDVRGKFADLGVETIGNSPDEFAAAIKSEIPKWAKVIKDAGIIPD